MSKITLHNVSGSITLNYGLLGAEFYEVNIAGPTHFENPIGVEDGKMYKLKLQGASELTCATPTFGSRWLEPNPQHTPIDVSSPMYGLNSTAADPGNLPSGTVLFLFCDQGNLYRLAYMGNILVIK